MRRLPFFLQTASPPAMRSSPCWTPAFAFPPTWHSPPLTTLTWPMHSSPEFQQCGSPPRSWDALPPTCCSNCWPAPTPHAPQPRSCCRSSGLSAIPADAGPQRLCNFCRNPACRALETNPLEDAGVALPDATGTAGDNFPLDSSGSFAAGAAAAGDSFAPLAIFCSGGGGLSRYCTINEILRFDGSNGFEGTRNFSAA